MSIDEAYELIYKAWIETGDERYDTALDVLANIDLLTN